MRFLGFLLISLLFPSCNSFLSNNHRRHILNRKLFSTPSDYQEDDFQYSKEYYEHLQKYNLIKKPSMLSSSSNPYLDMSIRRFQNYQIFTDNLEKIEQFNQGSDNLKLEMNQFGDQYSFDSVNSFSKQNDINYNIAREKVPANYNHWSFRFKKFLYYLTHGCLFNQKKK